MGLIDYTLYGLAVAGVLLVAAYPMISGHISVKRDRERHRRILAEMSRSLIRESKENRDD